MIKSVYSARLEETARKLADPDDAFITIVSTLPQKDGVDKALWEWVEEQDDSLTLSDFEYMRLKMCLEASGADNEA